MLRRPYGTTGEELSIIGFGGIVVDRLPQDEADAYVKEAIDGGVNYFDVAPSYGNAQDQLGPAIEPYRKDIFLACKTAERTKDGAQREMEESLQKLRTDYFDLYQLHGMTTEEDFEQAMGPNGALEVLQKAKEKGIVKYLGFSAHSVDIALRLIDAFDFQSVLFPINFVTWFNGKFGLQVVDKAKQKDMGVLALKAMAKQTWPEGVEKVYDRCWYEPIDEPEMAKLAVRYTLSQGATAAIPPGDIRLFRLGMEAGQQFTPITAEEEQILRDYAQERTPIFTTVG